MNSATATTRRERQTPSPPDPVTDSVASAAPPKDTNSRRLVANQLWRSNQHERACFGLHLPANFGRITASRSGVARALSPAIHSAMKNSTPLVRRFVHYFNLAIRFCRVQVCPDTESSGGHPIQSFPVPPAAPEPPTSSPNMTRFSSLVSSMRAITPRTGSTSCAASLPELKRLVGSAQGITVARAWILCDAVVLHCLENSGSQHPDIQLEEITRSVV